MSTTISGYNVCGNIYSELFRDYTISKLDQGLEASEAELLSVSLSAIHAHVTHVLEKSIIKIQIGRLEEQFLDKISFIAALDLPEGQQIWKQVAPLNLNREAFFKDTQIITELTRSLVSTSSRPFFSFNNKCDFLTLQFEKTSEKPSWRQVHSESNWKKFALKIKSKRKRNQFIRNHIRADIAQQAITKVERMKSMKKPTQKEASPTVLRKIITKLQKENESLKQDFELVKKQRDTYEAELDLVLEEKACALLDQEDISSQRTQIIE